MAKLVQGGGMAAELNLSQQDLYADVRAYLLLLFPECEVIQGYSNNVPLPAGAFVLMNILRETDLSTNATAYSDKKAHVSRSVEVRMQLDFYGVGAGERVRIFANLWRDHHAADILRHCQPLYSEEPRYLPLENEAAAFEERWLLEAALNYNPTISHDQERVKTAAISLHQP